MISTILIFGEVALVAATAYLFFTGAIGASIDVLIVAGFTGAVLATMVFLTRLKL